MLRPTTRFLRFGAACLLVLQLTVIGSWRPHEGTAGSRAAAAHVEAGGAKACPTAHDEARCTLCQATTLRVVVTHADPLRVPEAQPDGMPSAAASPPSPGSSPATRHPRAPPIVIA